MNKYKTAGFIIAIVLLVIGFGFKFIGGEIFGVENAEMISFPVMTVGLWVMAVVDTVGYRKQKSTGLQKGVDFMRIIGEYVVSVILTVATVIYLIYR